MEFQEVEFEVFKKFIHENGYRKWPLSASPLPMLEEYVDKKGEVMATAQHTMAKQVYKIRTDKNYESLPFITNIINGKQGN